VNLDDDVGKKGDGGGNLSLQKLLQHRFLHILVHGAVREVKRRGSPAREARTRWPHH
jgi:hypothetical protein